MDPTVLLATILTAIGVGIGVLAVLIARLRADHRAAARRETSLAAARVATARARRPRWAGDPLTPEQREELDLW
jgi:hypothetical protein